MGFWRLLGEPLGTQNNGYDDNAENNPDLWQKQDTRREMNRRLPWFRFYTEALDDPKVQRLAPHLFKSWVNLLCLAGENGGKLPSIDDVAFKLRLSAHEAKQHLDELILSGLIDISPAGDREPHNWSGRQCRSDTSADRVAKHREKKKKQPVETTCNVTRNENVTSQSREEEEKDTEEEVIVRSEYDAPREATSGRTAAFADLKNQFNGATGSMLEFIDGCMGPGDNRANSERWLASTVAAHGAQPVAQAFAMLTEKRASGAMIARPLAHWSNVASSLKAKASAPQGRPTIKPGGTWEALQRRIKASEEAAA